MAGIVTLIFRRIAPAILWMTLASGETLGVTEGHEIWTHQVGWVHAAKVVPGDTLLGLAGEPVEIVDITLDPTPTMVYNFEVDGTFTYYADGVWVHNNSCDIHLHHVWPMFLGGPKKGLLAGLSEDMHEDFHRILGSELAKRGLSLSGLKGDNWSRLLEDGDNWRKATDALSEACDYFDRLNGTKLSEFLRKAAGGV